MEEDWAASKVLLPLDGTEMAEGILDHATELGTLFGTTYHLVRVVPYSKSFMSSYPPDLIRMNRDASEKAKEEADAYLQAQVGSLRARGLTVDWAVVEGGQAGHGILAEAERAGCDLIAMATRGRGAIARTLLGSTADKVVRGASVPVLLLRQPGQE